MSPVKLDAEWAPVWQVISSFPKPVINDVFDQRKASNIALKAANEPLVIPDNITEIKHTITSLDGASIDVHQFVPAAAAAAADSKPQRALLYAFGGGMIAGSIDIWRKHIQDLAHANGAQVFAVHYRLAPEHPAPAAVEDFYAAAAWLQARAASFNVDPRRVILYGGSAGGGIAAGTALLIRDKGELIPPAALLLVYPMLDDRTVLSADSPVQDFLIWKSKANDLAWAAYLGNERDQRTEENVSIYGAPARAKDLSGLPDTYIDVGALDLFVYEDLEFARRLTAAGVSTEFHLYPGVPHGFESARHIQVVKEAISHRSKFLAKY
ncbi:Alpha/Beta hydrolase protein [Hypoxylon argillaceum]|nr:Alpha/Beta hydrolase protein [Hypoxylon argillaceum]